MRCPEIRRAARVAGLGPALLLMAGLSTAQDSGARPGPGSVHELLGKLDPERTDSETARRIARLGEQGLEQVLALLTREAVDGWSPGPRATLEEALGQVPRPLANDFLKRATAQPDSVARDSAALWMYGALGDPAGMTPMTRLANGQPERLAPAYRAALGRVLAREPRAHVSVGELGRLAALPLLPALAGAIGDVGSREGLEALVSLFHRTEESDAVVLQELARVANRHPGVCDERVVARVRPYLEQASDSALVACVTVLGRLEDAESADPLTALLDSTDPMVASEALRSLQTIGRQRFPAKRGLWEVWLRDQHRWWQEEAPELLETLEDGDAPLILRRLRLLSAHPLHRNLLAPEIVPLLDHPDLMVRRFACVVLGQLGSTLAVPALERALRDEELVDEALQALERIAPRSNGHDPD